MSTSVRAARIELLVISDLTSGTTYTEVEVRTAIARVIQQHHGIHAAIADAAGELGDHPDIWVIRFAWARTVIETVYPAAPRQRRHNTLSTSPRTTASV